MFGHRAMTADDYVGMLKRHRWQIIIPILLTPLLAFGVSLLLPESYTSTTLVLVEGQRVPTSIVQSTVTDALAQRLGTMQQQILSRTRLKPIIEKFGLYKSEVASKVPMEDLVAQMRKSITVTTVKTVGTSKQNQDVPGFTIAFEADNPKTSQLVCSEILSLFIDENIKLRSESADSTTAFLGKQVNDAKAKLDEKDKRVADFKRTYLGQLPGQEQTNMNIYMGLSQQLEAVNQLLTRTHQDKTYAESQLAQQITAWEASQAGNNPQTLEQQLAAMQNQLIGMEARYTPEHPDIIKLKADIAQLQKKIGEANATAKDKPAGKNKDVASLMEPVSIQQLRGLIHGYELTLNEKTRDQERIQEQIKVYRSRVELSPLVEQKYNEILRDYTTAQQFYDDLLKKRGNSEVAADLERQQESEQFRVMDPPNLPVNPTFPNRLLFALGGLGGGMMLGVGLALLLEMKDKAIRTESDIEALLQLPTLALVPSVLESRTRTHGLLSRIRKQDTPALPAAGD